MFESLVVTLREGIEAALVVGIIVIYLRRTGRERLSRWAYLGLGAGIAASLACAVLVATLGIREENYEGWLMILGAAFVATMVVWMMRTARTLKHHIETRVESIATQGRGSVAAGLFGLSFVLVLREGVETVLFLSAVTLTTDALLAFLGGTLGIALAVLFGVSFVRGTARVDLARFFNVTAIVLLVLAAQLLIGGLHEFGELGWIPVGEREMRIIGPIVKNDVMVLVALLALPLVVLLVPGRGERQRVAAAASLEGPERRLALAGLRRERLWRRVLAAAGIIVVASLTVSYAFSRLPAGIDPPRMLEPGTGGAERSGEVRLRKADLDDGRLHRFGVAIDGVVVRFIVIRSGSRLVPVFDACQICGASGYVQTKGRLVCLACAADLNPATIGVGGGCNPLPLAYRDEGSELVIALEDLRAQADAFGTAGAGAAAAAIASPRPD
jgi:high-affinity iron transporter